MAVEVYRHSDGSFLESQDMFRLPGIFRTVALTAKPQVQVRDFKAIPDLDETYSNAKLAYHSPASEPIQEGHQGLHYPVFTLCQPPLF